MGVAVVTGSGGLIGSESVAFLRRAGVRRDRRRERHARALLRRRGVDRSRRPSACVRAYASFRSVERSTSAIARGSTGCSRGMRQASSWSFTPRRNPRTTGRRRSSDRLRGQRQRHAQPARGDTSHAPDAAFIFTSTNKVYGDLPNPLPLVELDTRVELPEITTGTAGSTRHVDRPADALAVRGIEDRG